MIETTSCNLSNISGNYDDSLSTPSLGDSAKNTSSKKVKKVITSGKKATYTFTNRDITLLKDSLKSVEKSLSRVSRILNQHAKKKNKKKKKV